MTGRRILLPAALLMVAAAAQAQRAVPSLTGTWNAETDSGGGKTQSKLLLKMEGDKLTGTLKTSFGDFPLQDGSVEGVDVCGESADSGLGRGSVDCGEWKATGGCAGDIRACRARVEKWRPG